MIRLSDIAGTRLIGVRVVTPPEAEPLSVSAVQEHLGMDTGDAPPPALYRLITSARQWAEHFTGRALAPQTVAVRYEGCALPLRLYRPPFASLTSVSTFYQGAETEEDPDAFYAAGAEGDRPMLRLADTGSLIASSIEEIEVRYAAGYSTPDDVPDLIREAMLLWIADRFDTRQSIAIGTTMNVLPVSPETLLMPYKVIV